MRRRALFKAVLRNPFPLIYFIFLQSPSKIPMRKVFKFLPNDPKIIEAGIGDGQDTLKFAKKFPLGFVYGLEPIETLFRIANKNTNEYSNIKIYREALTRDETASIDMHTFESKAHHSSSVLEPTGHLENFPNIKFGKSISVPSISLDNFMTREGINQVDLLWLDLQGYEIEVLTGSVSRLKEIRVIHLETSRIAMYNNAPNHDDVCTWMKKHGFHPRIIRSPWIFGNVIFLNENFLSKGSQ
jgi:FkbM family methyltransferase